MVKSAAFPCQLFEAFSPRPGGHIRPGIVPGTVKRIEHDGGVWQTLFRNRVSRQTNPKVVWKVRAPGAQIADLLDEVLRRRAGE